MEMNQQYELTFVVSGVLNEQQTQNTINQVRNEIEDNGGEIIEVNEWGSRRLAYQIDKKRSGYYTTIYFQASGDAIGSVERAMKINDDILRYLTLRMDAAMLRHYEKQKQLAAQSVEASEEEE